MNLVKVLANRINYGNKRNTNNIKWLVIHYTANDGDSAKGNGNYFKNNKPKASAHYFVDDNVIVNSVPDNYTAYAVGGKKYNNNGGKYYGVCTNANSISIELCDTQRNGKSDLSEKTRKNAIELARYLCKKYKIDKNHVIRHYDITSKLCPKYFVEDEKAWKKFKDDIFATAITPTTIVKKPTVINSTLVKEMQKALNSAYKLKLVIDGKLGEKTKTAIKTYLIRNGSKGTYAKWVQKRLNAKGYNIATDGVFGSKSVAALKKYQKAKGLTVDGVCGYATVYELVK